MLYRITEIRESKNISMSQLAKMANISRSVIYYIETYKKSPNMTTLEKIAKALNVKVSNLLNED